MKKTIALCSALLVALFLTACGQDTNDTNDTNNQADNETTENETTENETENTGDHVADDEEQTMDGNGSETEEADPKNEAGNQADMKEMMEALDFDKIEIEISYGNDQDYDMEIEYHGHGDVEAEIEDEINGVDIDNDLKAFNHMYPSVKELDIDRSMDKQTMIDQVLEAFELGNDYEEFEIEITFEDGTKLSFEDRK